MAFAAKSLETLIPLLVMHKQLRSYAKRALDELMIAEVSWIGSENIMTKLVENWKSTKITSWKIPF